MVFSYRSNSRTVKEFFRDRAVQMQTPAQGSRAAKNKEAAGGGAGRLGHGVMEVQIQLRLRAQDATRSKLSPNCPL
jgi:hypothetical protein